MPPGVLQLEWCATYSGPVRAALHALKYRGERRLAEPLATALARRWRRVGRGGEVVTWVPVHATRRRERGFDQAEALMTAASQAGVPIAQVGRFGGDRVAFGDSEGFLSDLDILYRSAFEAAVGNAPEAS